MELDAETCSALLLALTVSTPLPAEVLTGRDEKGCAGLLVPEGLPTALESEWRPAMLAPTLQA